VCVAPKAARRNLSVEVLGHSAQIAGLTLGDRELPVLEDTVVVLCRTRLRVSARTAPAGDIGAQPRSVEITQPHARISLQPFPDRYRKLVECILNRIKHFRAFTSRFETHYANNLTLAMVAAVVRLDTTFERVSSLRKLGIARASPRDRLHLEAETCARLAGQIL
jgi:hypothetical protein